MTKPSAASNVVQNTTIDYLPLFNTRGDRLTAIDPGNPVFVLNDSEKRIDITLSKDRGKRTGVLCKQISNDGQDWGDTWATTDDLGKLTSPAAGGRAAAARRPPPSTGVLNLNHSKLMFLYSR